MSQQKWNDKEIKFLKDNKNIPVGELRNLLNKKFKTKRSYGSVYYAITKYSKISQKDVVKDDNKKNIEDIKNLISQKKVDTTKEIKFNLDQVMKNITEVINAATKMQDIIEEKEKEEEKIDEPIIDIENRFTSIFDSLKSISEEVAAKAEKVATKASKHLDTLIQEAEEKSKKAKETIESTIAENVTENITELSNYKKLIKKFVKDNVKTKIIHQYLLHNTSLEVTKDVLKKYIKENIKKSTK